MHSSPQIPLYVVTSVWVCVCVRKRFACAPYSISFFPPSSSCETSRKPSIILMTITTCISICWPQMSRRAVVWLDSEGAPKDRRKQRLETLGPLSGDPLPTQGPALSTPAHTQLQRHTDDSREAVFEQWQQVLDQSDCCSRCCPASQWSTAQIETDSAVSIRVGTLKPHIS